MATEITILSGKGGAGKTVITAAIASLAQSTVFCDNDVDAADLHLIFNPRIKETHQFDSGSYAVINPAVCVNCELCIGSCRFGAIHKNSSDKPVINKFQCEGCRLCERLCPEKAILTVKNNNNSWFVSDSRFGILVHAQMGPGEENSGKLVTQIRNKSREIAAQTNAEFIINDGPPGIGCSAIAAVTGVDAVLLVAEPSVSGLHDIKRLHQLTQSFGIPAFGIINKCDINPAITLQTEKFMHKNHISLLGKIPFDAAVVESVVHQKAITEFAPHSVIAEEISIVWKKLTNFAVKV